MVTVIEALDRETGSVLHSFSGDLTLADLDHPAPLPDLDHRDHQPARGDARAVGYRVKLTYDPGTR